MPTSFESLDKSCASDRYRRAQIRIPLFELLYRVDHIRNTDYEVGKRNKHLTSLSPLLSHLIFETYRRLAHKPMVRWCSVSDPRPRKSASFSKSSAHSCCMRVRI
jgi:hypothetical protein